MGFVELLLGRANVVSTQAGSYFCRQAANYGQCGRGPEYTVVVRCCYAVICLIEEKRIGVRTWVLCNALQEGSL